jgi:hypothetical protein
VRFAWPADIRTATQSTCGFPVFPVRAAADGEDVSDADASTMIGKSYAVWWQEGKRQRRAGRLQLGPLHLLFSGNGSARLAVPLDEIVSADYRHGELSLVRTLGELICVGNLDGPGALRELGEALARGT